MDPWDRDNFDELEDHDDNKSKNSASAAGNTAAQRQKQGMSSSKAMQDKRNALFGL